MAEYIEREKALIPVSEWYRKALRPENRSQYNDGERAAYKTALNEINSIPAADVAPVKHGRWFVSIGKDGKPVGTICPICGFAWSEAIDAVKLEPCLSLIETAYCPNCGAKMDGGET